MVLYDANRAYKYDEIVKNLTVKPDKDAIKHIVDLIGRYPSGKSVRHCEDGCRKNAAKCDLHGKAIELCKGGLFRCDICFKSKYIA